MALPISPFRQDEKIFVTPLIGDVLFSELRDCTRINIPEYGTPHPDTKKWPDHKLVYVAEEKEGGRDQMYRFFYAADRENQDLYNFQAGVKQIEGREFKIVQRSYITPRADYDPNVPAFGTAMPNVPEGKFDGVSYSLYDKQQVRIDQKELDALYVVDTHTYVESALLTELLDAVTSKPNLVPEKFRTNTPTTSTSVLVEGIVTQPVLSGSEVTKRETQVNPDVKKVTTESQDDTTLPVSFEQKATNERKQLVTINETLQIGDTSQVPTATKDVQSEAIGDGKYVVRTESVPEVFDAKSVSVEKSINVIPEKFLSDIKTTRESEVVEGQVPSFLELSGDQIAKSEQQVTEFTKEVTTTTRKVPTGGVVLKGSEAYADGAFATVTEELGSEGLTAERGFTVVRSTVTPIGNGKAVRETVKADFKSSQEQEYDAVLNLPIEKTRQFVTPGQGLGQDYTTITYVNDDRSLQVVEKVPHEALQRYMVEVPVMESVNFPPKLERIEVDWNTEVGEGFGSGGFFATSNGPSGSLSGTINSSGQSSAALQPTVSAIITKPWSGPVGATGYFFYLAPGQDVKSKLPNVQFLPPFKPAAVVLTAVGGRANLSIKQSESPSISWDQTSEFEELHSEASSRAFSSDQQIDIAKKVDTIVIEPTIHGNITISEATKETTVVASVSVVANGEGKYAGLATAGVPGILSHTLKGSITPTHISATEPPEYPTGKYITQIDARPYKWGYTFVYVVVVDFD